MRKRLSVLLITYNEQAVLEACLHSVAWADEIIILDHHSDDDTVAIARRMGAQVYQSNDWPGFGLQRQRVQQYAQGDYILMLDADERVTPELQASIMEILAQNHDMQRTVYACARKNFFLNTFLRYSGCYPDWVIRLYARQHYRYNDNAVHETLDYGAAAVRRLKGDLHHFTAHDLNSFQHKQLRYAQDWANERHAKGSKTCLLAAFGHALVAFIKVAFLQCGFLEGGLGFLIAMIKAQYTFNKYAALWALQQQRSSSLDITAK